MGIKLTSILLTSVAVALIAAYFLVSPQQSTQVQMVNINGISIPIEVASTPVARARGLSGRASLTEGSGMFFVFEEEDEWGIWMKEMNFALDIVWADSTGKIITIKKNISPETYPQTFYPATPSKYVLEVPAGFTELHAIAEGDEIIIHANPAL